MIRKLILWATCLMVVGGVSAQTVLVNGTTCPGAYVTLSAGVISINTKNCSSVVPPVVVPPVVVPPVVVPPVGTDLTVDNFLIPNPSKEPGKWGVAHQGINGAGPASNAWAVTPTRCSTSPTLTRSWQHNINFDPYSYGFSNDPIELAPNEAISYRFVPTAVGIGTITLTETTAGPLPANFITISSTPCDFNYVKLGNGAVRDFCYKSATRENSLYFQVTTGAASNITYCKLVPGQTYYFNVRWQDGRIPATTPSIAPTDSCAANGAAKCTGLIQIGR